MKKEPEYAHFVYLHDRWHAEVVKEVPENFEKFMVTKNHTIYAERTNRVRHLPDTTFLAIKNKKRR